MWCLKLRKVHINKVCINTSQNIYIYVITNYKSVHRLRSQILQIANLSITKRWGPLDSSGCYGIWLDLWNWQITVMMQVAKEASQQVEGCLREWIRNSRSLHKVSRGLLALFVAGLPWLFCCSAQSCWLCSHRLQHLCSLGDCFTLFHLTHLAPDCLSPPALFAIPWSPRPPGSGWLADAPY